MTVTHADSVFAHFPQLEAGDLCLRALRPEDTDCLYTIFSDKLVTEHYDLDTLTDPSQARDLIERFNHRFDNRIGMRWAIVRTQSPEVVIGTCGYNIWIQPSARAVLGYDLGRRYWRRGIMSMALQATLRFGFQQMALNRIEALAFTENTASRRLLEKLGFSCDGVLREYELVSGRFVDMAMYSLLRREFTL